MKIIGLGHYSRVGKDSVANSLVASLRDRAPHLRVKKMSFAWQLKNISYDLYRWDGMKPPHFYDTPEGEKYRDILLPTIGKTPVQIWIDLGNALRDQVYPLTWVHYVSKGIEDVDVLIVPDVRFPNEVNALRQNRDVTVLAKIVRPGYGPRPSISDRILLPYRGWDYVVGASGEMSELYSFGDTLASICLDGAVMGQTKVGKEKAIRAEKITAWEGDRDWLPEGAYIVDGRLNIPYSSWEWPKVSPSVDKVAA